MSKKKKEMSSSDYTPEVIDITRSYSRKLNMSAHGGVQYETADITATRTAHNVPVEFELGTSVELYKACVAEVEMTIKMIDEEAGVETADEDDGDFEEAPKKSKKAKKAKKEVVEEEEDEDEDEEAEEDDEEEDEEEDEDEEEEAPAKAKMLNVDGFKMKRSEFEDASPYINDINLSKTTKELKKAVARIQGDAGNFTDMQKKYLSALFKKKNAELSEDED